MRYLSSKPLLKTSSKASTEIYQTPTLFRSSPANTMCYYVTPKKILHNAAIQDLMALLITTYAWELSGELSWELIRVPN
jgi:hypothetical protein